MSPENLYVIDTSSLINLARWNPHDMYVTVWQNVEGLVSDGRLVAPQAVLDEISVGSDQLALWAKRHKMMFKTLTRTQITQATKILKDWPSLAEPDKESTVADPFVVALALDKNTSPTLMEVGRSRVVVCDESSRRGRIKIPHVCSSLGVTCITALDMFRTEGWQF